MKASSTNAASYLAASLFLFAVNAGAQVYVSNTEGDTVTVINPTTNTVTTTITVGDEPRNLAAAPTLSRVYVPNRNSNNVSVISTATNAVVATVTDASFDEPYAIAVTPDGSEAWVANKEGGGSSTGSVTIITTATNTVATSISDPCFVSPEAIAINPVLNVAYVINRGDGVVCIVNRTTRLVTGSVSVGGEPRYAVVLPDGSAVFVSRDSAGGVSRIATATNVVTSIATGGTPRNMDVNASGSKVYVALQNGDLGVINTATNTPSTITLTGASSTYGVAVADALNRAYVTDEDSDTVHVVNTLTDTQISGAGLPITDLAFDTPRAIASVDQPVVVTPGISINDVSITEGNAGQTNAVFTVTLSSPSASVVTVSFATADGTATVGGADYVATAGVVTFVAGDTSETITVPINGDTAVEIDETFFVNLSAPANATISDSQGQGTILNDDSPVVLTTDLTISKSASPNLVAPGGQVTYTIVVTNNGPGPASGVVITDTLPSGTSFVSAAGCTNSSGVVTCNIGSLTNGQSVTRTIVIQAPSALGSFVNTASVSGAEVDPSPASNSATGTAATADLTPIPTVGEWGLVFLTLLLMITALSSMRTKGSTT